MLAKLGNSIAEVLDAAQRWGTHTGTCDAVLFDDKFQLVRLRPTDFPAHTGYALPTLVDSIECEHGACDKDLADAAVYVGGFCNCFYCYFRHP